MAHLTPGNKPRLIAPFTHISTSVAPPPFVWAEGTFTEEVRLLPEERRAIAYATQTRRICFAGARACARVAMAELGATVGPIRKARSGAPLWPLPELVGSLSHSGPVCAAAVGRVADVLSIGIDIESRTEIPVEVQERVASVGEYECLKCGLTRSDDLSVVPVIVFSAKEACYKALPRQCQIASGLPDIGLHEFKADTHEHGLGGSFIAELLPRGHGGTTLRGLFQQCGCITRSVAWHLPPH